jgi:hypothetical protein
MIIDQIKALLGNGFRPFALCLSDGRKFNVPHRDFIALSSKSVVVYDEQEPAHIINPLHIVSIEGPTVHEQKPETR